MSAYATLDEWLSTISKEYLQDYIRTGGAAVKFVIPVEGTGAAEIKTRLQAAAESDGFHFAFVDAASVKIHMVDQIFYQVARQVDWGSLAYSFLRGLLGQPYELPETREAFDLKRIAALNGVDEKQMRSNVNERLKQALFRDYAMTQEFRIAMLRLCQAQLDPGEVSSALCDSIVWWLRGELRLISALKPALIFQKAGRHNARHLLLSLSHWIRIAGGSGLVLVLDISRYMSDRPREPDTAPCTTARLPSWTATRH